MGLATFLKAKVVVAVVRVATSFIMHASEEKIEVGEKMRVEL